MNVDQHLMHEGGEITRRTIRGMLTQPLIIWAALGLFFLALQLFVLSSWLMSENFAVVDVGADPVPLQMKILAWVTQFNALLLLLLCVLYCIRKSRREGCMTWDVLLIVGGLSVCWLDTAVNFFKPTVLYNRYMLNFGSWNSFIPGWSSTAHEQASEPLLFVIGLYGWWFVLFGMIFCAVARWFKRRWPQLERGRLWLTGFIALFVTDMLLELILMVPGLYAYNVVIPSLTLWSGQTFQIPLYGVLIISALCAAVSILRYQAEVDGCSSIEKLSPSIAVSSNGRLFLRFLAMIGFINVMYITAIIAHWVFGFFGETTLIFPSYMGG